MGVNFEQLGEYLNNRVPKRPLEMQKMEAYAHKHHFPIIGPAAGYFCYQIARMIQARRIFELGSGYGYSTAWFARAVQENGGGQVFHTVWDEQLSQMAQQHLTTLGYADIVSYHVSEAVQALKATEGPFDLIFNDIDKEGYPDSLPVIESKLRTGGVMIVDNMFLHGRVMDSSDQSPMVQGIRRLTEMVMSSPKWIASIVPIRDGLLLAVKQ